SEEHTSELQSLTNLVCRLLLEKKKKTDSADHPRRLDEPHHTTHGVKPIRRGELECVELAVSRGHQHGEPHAATHSVRVADHAPTRPPPLTLHQEQPAETPSCPSRV